MLAIACLSCLRLLGGCGSIERNFVRTTCLNWDRNLDIIWFSLNWTSDICDREGIGRVETGHQRLRKRPIFISAVQNKKCALRVLDKAEYCSEPA
jgi:hypothetical protein